MATLLLFLINTNVISGIYALMDRYEFSCYLVHMLILFSNPFTNSLVYLRKCATQVFIPLMRFLQCSLISSIFLFSRGILFIFFFLLCMFIGDRFQYSQVFKVSFFLSVMILSRLGSSIPSVICGFPPFIISMAQFCMPYLFSVSWLYIFKSCIKVSNSFWFSANNFMSSMYMRYLIFPTRFLKFLSTSAFTKYVIKCHHRYYKR